MSLVELGYTSDFARGFNQIADDSLSPCRVSLEQRGLYAVLTDQGEMPAVPTGKLLYGSDDRADLPVVGDWVAAQILDEQPPRAIIHCVLPRKSMFSRKEAGKRVSRQPIASNIDTVFIVMSLDNDFSPARAERYLALAWESGAEPVVLLTKCDQCSDVDASIDIIRASAPGVPVHAVSVVAGQGLSVMSDYLKEGITVALLGSSGVGKSTLVNYLLGSDLQRVREVREVDSKGRHTTTHRQLFVLPGGGLVIDTPGMREIQLWNVDNGLAEAFVDIEVLARQCRFGDCSHNDEPGCMVRAALNDGSLDHRRFDNYMKMQAELHFLERKQDAGLARVEREKWKNIHKQIRKMDKK
ncbi:MAG: ribosome small subunit-dependent GTPase A [Armatimonadota bacterium]|nr:ribosome small subunit-dependent GTPase A [bacterium]